MKKIIISTFNNSNNNYGALFQSCAFSAFLRELGYDAYNITVKNRKTTHDTGIIKLKKKLKRMLLMSKRKRIDERIRKFTEFSVQNQQQLVYENLSALCADPPEADVYISGSDQVWNPSAFHEDFFLCYADDSKKKISYAASMGKEKIPESKEQKFADYIARYDSVSVREDSMIPIIGKYTDNEIYQHVDPVFLMSRDWWAGLEKPYEKLKYDKFILVYVLEWTTEHNERLLELKKKTGLPCVSVNTGNIKKICADQIIYDASPNEFLYMLGKASYVASSSFHGTAMSVVYNKTFMSFVGTDKPTRITSLLRHYGIGLRDTAESALTEINYTEVNRIIAQDREEARKYLINSIEN